jgi:phosphate-selective porin
MKLLAIALVLAPAIAAADVTIIDNGKTVAVDCAKDPAVSLIGNHLTVTLTGTCKKLDVSGNHETVKGSADQVYIQGNENTISIDASKTISVAGNKNIVTWKSGAPKLSNAGKDNKVTQSH